ncbi:hypothetical protein [Longispora albida]|uniref:hypothetical protein n=1 Tax=Longispora albida TaxID=203523 RepID=UPI000367FFCC|nr:hypothetical protein [Longispora albida]
MSAAVARNIPPEDDHPPVVPARRPTRAGISDQPAPARRGGRRLTLVTEDIGDEFAGVEPGRPAQAKPKPRQQAPKEPDSRVRTEGSAALKPKKAEPEQAKAEPVKAAELTLAPPAPVATARMPFVVLTLGLIVSGIVGLLLLNIQINQDAFELQRLRDKQTELDSQEQQLNKDLAKKEAPGNLAAEAARLGMVPIGSPAYIVLPDGRTIGVPQPAGQPRR